MRSSLRVFLVSVALTLTASAAAAAELVMVDLPSCTYCAKFRREVAPTYNATEIGRLAPLRRVSPLKRWPDDLRAVKQVPYTPVFIVVENGREVGRFAGYVNADEFWAHLKPLVGRL